MSGIRRKAITFCTTPLFFQPCRATSQLKKKKKMGSHPTQNDPPPTQKKQRRAPSAVIITSQISTEMTSWALTHASRTARANFTILGKTLYRMSLYPLLWWNVGKRWSTKKPAIMTLRSVSPCFPLRTACFCSYGEDKYFWVRIVTSLFYLTPTRSWVPDPVFTISAILIG